MCICMYVYVKPHRVSGNSSSGICGSVSRMLVFVEVRCTGPEIWGFVVVDLDKVLTVLR